MTTKRMTKKQREADHKKALMKRIRDIYSGALGDEYDPDQPCVTACELSKIIPAIQATFGEVNQKTFLWAPSNIDQFDTAEDATDFLFRNGIRA